MIETEGRREWDARVQEEERMTEKGKDGEQKREMANDKIAMGRRREIQRI